MFGKVAVLALVIIFSSLSSSQNPPLDDAKVKHPTQKLETQDETYRAFLQAPPMDANMKAMFQVYIKAGGTYSYDAFAHVYMATYGFNPGVIEWYMWSLYNPYGYSTYRQY